MSRRVFFQIAELKAAQAPSTSAMRNALLDPAVNIIVSKLTQVKSIASTSIENYKVVVHNLVERIVLKKNQTNTLDA